jgi:exopolysaccharide biosynthesis polyprenyl glycosylphosphotransferase
MTEPSKTLDLRLLEPHAGRSADHADSPPVVTPLLVPREEPRGLLPRTLGRAPLFRPSMVEGSGSRTVEARDALYRRLLAAADIAAAGLALLIFVGGLGPDQLRLTALLALPIVVLVSKVIGLYDRDEIVLQKSTLDEAPKLFQLATLYALLIWVLERTMVDGELGRPQVVGLWAGLFVLLLACRASARRLAATAAPTERCMVIGEAAGCEQVRSKLEANARINATVVAWVPLHDESPADGSASYQWTADDLESMRTTHDIHRIILAPGHATGDDILDLVRVGKALGLRVSLLPRMFDVVGTSVEFDQLDGMTVLGIRRFGLSRSSRTIKRTLDAAGAALGLLVCAPIFAAIAIAIRLDTRGPILFRQTRIGRKGAPFEIVKFRTMVVDAEDRKTELREHNEADGLFKIAEDPRITRVGRLLRRSSLDELPQLLNVLRGEMSLVGPRPLICDEDEQLQGWHRRRLQLKPGMTGHWQVLGSSRIPLSEMVKIDYLYVANWSLWRDIKILLRTVPYMLSRRGL